MKTRENELHQPKITTEYTARNTWLVILECWECGLYLSDFEHADKLTAQEQAHLRMPNYCPCCGARLKEVQEW